MTQNIKRPRCLISEKLESPAQQQSQELYLVPRNCWLHVTSFQIRPASVEKNQKIRIRFSVPNSYRVVRTSTILIDDELMNYIQSSQNAAGLTELPVDITVLFEYKHDVRFGHQSNLDIDIEIPQKLPRSKSIGAASIDLSNAIQAPISTTLILRKDNTTTASLKIELHSITILKSSPLSTNSISPSILSESDSESIPSITTQIEKKVKDIILSKNILVFDADTPQGQIFMGGTGQNNFVLPVRDQNLIQFIFDISSKLLKPNSKTPFRFIIAGDDDFISQVLKQYVEMRDRGIFSSHIFNFICIPLTDGRRCSFARKLSEKSTKYAENFLSKNWFSIFLEDSEVQNASSTIASKLDLLLKSPLTPVSFSVANVVITSNTDQFVIPMLVSLRIGKQSTNVQMKVTFTETKSKTSTLRFNALSITLDRVRLIAKWTGPTVTKSTEKKEAAANKINLAAAKGQAPVDVEIDGIVYKDAIVIMVMLREREAELMLYTI
ncbi:phosphofurin acidic cluster sorting protein 2 [Histomonas meleagridis]|uniref:phosphofurin acidic cluster sorting protein 2 n=1 Tax=Histomonas meleagridis TaxID=135588 RepID=UPI00355ABFFC|nr:phosphofurin acidic cluster sorting protein 2 [Histomonas meleagridis]KAH0804520.1 phosphofurin acidic cluster sorting protein 2 [Histomonas meleagridis]